MHTAALDELGLGDSWSYEAIDVAPESFERLVRSLPDDDFAGVNVTVPHKRAALALADEVSQAAREIGAANTLTFKGGRIEADNTDASGLLNALPQPPVAQRALVLGAGGSARAAVWALLGAGADVAVRFQTAERATELAQALGATAVAEPDPTTYGLLVNATTVGMAEASGDVGPGLKALPVPDDEIQATQLVVDLVYGSVETPLIIAAKARGAQTVDGLEVLVHQGAASLRLWTGSEPPLETMRRAARAG